MKSQFLHAVANQRHALGKAAIDEHVSLRARDQVRGQSPAAHVIHISHHAVRREGLRPIRRLRGHRRGHTYHKNEDSEYHIPQHYSRWEIQCGSIPANLESPCLPSTAIKREITVSTRVKWCGAN